MKLAGRERSWQLELAGRDQQRVALARSLARRPRLLLADEPFGALDAPLRKLSHAHRPAVLLVTHDVDEAIALADRVVVLDGARIVSDIAVALPAETVTRRERSAILKHDLLRRLGVTPDAASA